jgi:hypothetical protein
MIYKRNTITSNNSEMRINKHPYLGYDERYVNYYTNITSYKLLKPEDSSIEQIARYMDVLEKINKLQNAKMLGPNIHDKTIQTILKDEIGYMDICAYSMKAGGLLTDW